MRQTYLLRKAGRYYFRRRYSAKPDVHPITLSLATADPADARRITHRLAMRWDEVTMEVNHYFERGTLTLDEQQRVFRSAMEQELAHATRAVRGSAGPVPVDPMHRKVLIAAYRIIGKLRHDAAVLTQDQFDEVTDESWSDAERELLRKTLLLHATPMTLSRTEVVDELREMGTPVNDQMIAEARWTHFAGRIEAQRRAGLVDHPLFRERDIPGKYLLDDALVEQARRDADLPPATAGMRMREALSGAATPGNDDRHWLYAKRSNVRFSEQIDELLQKLFNSRRWKPDNGRTRQILEAFAWITGDKPMSDYEPQDIDIYRDRLALIPTSFCWGRLNQHGGMETPYDPEAFARKIEDIPVSQRRSPRTVNAHLSKMQAASSLLRKSYWLPRSGHGNIMNFEGERMQVEFDPSDPKRMPWTPDHLHMMYSLPLWQGGGGANARLKRPKTLDVYQDAAYWVPLIATYTGLAREEACGLECIDFNFKCQVPYLLVQPNMTRSQDGETPAGLKRPSRYRVMPLHPELLRLGLEDYVRAVEASGAQMVFPELYSTEAKSRSNGKTAPAFGGRRFYAIAWRFIVDGTHALLPLPETRDGKKADFHSQRTYNNSVLASPGVSETIVADHMGHARSGVGPQHYNRRALTLGQVQELQERRDILVKVMPNVTAHVPRQTSVKLLALAKRSRVGSAPGRNAAQRFCE